MNSMDAFNTALKTIETKPVKAIKRLRKQIDIAIRKSKYGHPSPIWRDVQKLCDYIEAPLLKSPSAQSRAAH